MTTITAARPTSTRAFNAVSAPIELESLENTVQRTRRLARAAERRSHRTSTIASAVAVGVGSVGTLAFAILMVVSH